MIAGCAHDTCLTSPHGTTHHCTARDGSAAGAGIAAGVARLSTPRVRRCHRRAGSCLRIIPVHVEDFALARAKVFVNRDPRTWHAPCSGFQDRSANNIITRTIRTSLGSALFLALLVAVAIPAAALAGAKQQQPATNDLSASFRAANLGIDDLRVVEVGGIVVIR